jgi:hypothetical protein
MTIETDAPRFPPYLYTLIENFCLGTRRLELFGSPTHSRRGWVAAGLPPLPLKISSVEAFDSITYPSLLPEKSEGRDVLPFHHEVDMLRPKSPQRRGRPGQSIPLPVRPSPVPRPPMNQQMTFAGPSGMGMGMGNGMQPGFGYVQHQMIPQQMVMGYGGPFMNPAMGMGMGMGMGFNPQMAYMMQGINGGQPGNVNASGGMWMGQPGMGYGGIGEMGTEQQGYGAMMGQQGYGGMGIDQMGQGYGGMGGFDQMGQQQQGYGGMEYMGQGYGGMGGQEQNGTGWQGQWYQQ